MAANSETMAGRSREENVLLTLCIAGVMGIFPFSVYRAMQAQWLAAIVDLVIVAIVAAIFAYVWRTRNVRVPSIILTVSYMSVMVAVNYITGPSLIFWAYPTMAAAYFLVRPREGLIINIVALFALLPALMAGTSNLQMAGLLITLVLNNSFAYLYARFSLNYQEDLARIARLDALTGAGNRANFVDDMSKAIAGHKRFGSRLCLIMFDIDHFKRINDEFGHLTGDAVLVHLTKLCQERIRGVDRIYRIGGEEFAVLAGGVDAKGAMYLAEHIRQMVADAALPGDIHLTLSLGVAECTGDDTLESLIGRADQAMYLAKRLGRDRVCHEDEVDRKPTDRNVISFADRGAS